MRFTTFSRRLCSRVFLALTTLSLSTVACKPTYSDRAVYRSAFEGDVPSLDPIQIGDTQSHDVAHNIYNGLVRYRPEITGPDQKLSDLVPDLAESWTISDDGKTYTFKLKQNVKFHNGRPFVAQDVVNSYKRLANQNNASKGLWTLGALPIQGLAEYQAPYRALSDYTKACKEDASNCDLEREKALKAANAKLEEGEISGLKALDDHTLELTFDSVIPFALHVLAMSYYYIVPLEETRKWGDQFSFHATGTGAFKLKSWEPNQQLTLVKNEDFFEEGVPKLDELRFYIVPDENIRLLWFENGELEHLEPPIPAASFDRILSDPKWNPMGNEAIRAAESVNDPEKSNIIKNKEWTIQYLGMDTTSPPFNDKRVRHAFNYAINKRKIIDVVRNGRGIQARGVLPHDFPGFDPKRPVPYPFDLQKAKALMRQAGYVDSDGDGILEKDGEPFRLEFWHNQSMIYAMLGASVQADLRDLGVDVEVRSLEWASYIEKVKPKLDQKGNVIPPDAKLFRFGWAADYPDPDNYLWTLFHSDNIGQDNATSFSHPEVDALLDQARSTVNWPVREKFYQQAESKIIEEAPWIFLYTNVEYKLVQPYVKGQQMHPLIRNEMSVIELEPRS